MMRNEEIPPQDEQRAIAYIVDSGGRARGAPIAETLAQWTKFVAAISDGTFEGNLDDYQYYLYGRDTLEELISIVSEPTQAWLSDYLARLDANFFSETEPIGRSLIAPRRAAWWSRVPKKRLDELDLDYRRWQGEP